MDDAVDSTKKTPPTRTSTLLLDTIISPALCSTSDRICISDEKLAMVIEAQVGIVGNVCMIIGIFIDLLLYRVLLSAEHLSGCVDCEIASPPLTSVTTS